jgi:hypothetical protein
MPVSVIKLNSTEIDMPTTEDYIMLRENAVINVDVSVNVTDVVLVTDRDIVKDTSEVIGRDTDKDTDTGYRYRYKL